MWEVDELRRANAAPPASSPPHEEVPFFVVTSRRVRRAVNAGGDGGGGGEAHASVAEEAHSAAGEPDLYLRVWRAHPEAPLSTDIGSAAGGGGGGGGESNGGGDDSASRAAVALGVDMSAPPRFGALVWALPGTLPAQGDAAAAGGGGGAGGVASPSLPKLRCQLFRTTAAAARGEAAARLPALAASLRRGALASSPSSPAPAPSSSHPQSQPQFPSQPTPFGPRPLAAVAAACSGRGPALFGRAGDEAALLSASFPGAFVGLVVDGELGPPPEGGHPGLQTFTTAVLGLGA